MIFSLQILKMQSSECATVRQSRHCFTPTLVEVALDKYPRGSNQVRVVAFGEKLVSRCTSYF
jgi:hypothetical protein